MRSGLHCWSRRVEHRTGYTRGDKCQGYLLRPTVNEAGETLRYLATADLGTHKNLGERCCRATKLRGVVGASKKPLAEARCRSTMV